MKLYIFSSPKNCFYWMSSVPKYLSCTAFLHVRNVISPLFRFWHFYQKWSERYLTSIEFPWKQLLKNQKTEKLHNNSLRTPYFKIENLINNFLLKYFLQIKTKFISIFKHVINFYNSLLCKVNMYILPKRLNILFSSIF